jgi:hypothetical protein
MFEAYTVYLAALLALWSVARQYDRREQTVANPATVEPVNYDWR